MNWFLKPQIVRELVDTEKAILAGKASDPVRREQERPGQRVSVAQQICDCELQQHDA